MIKNLSFFITIAVAILASFVGLQVYQKRTTFGENGFGFSTTAEEVGRGQDLKGKVAIVTGGNAGLGLETVRILAEQGAHVIVMARSLEKANEAIAKLKKQKHDKPENFLLTPIACDLGSLTSIQQAVAEFKNLKLPLHYLINNAGIMALPKRTLTENGFESQIGVNHIGHFYLTNLLMENLLESKPSRVICVSSAGHRFANVSFVDDPNLETPYHDFTAYGNSKLSNILHAKEIHERYSKQGVYAYSLHPGGIFTNLAQHLEILHFIKFLPSLPFFKTVSEGTATTIYTALRAPLSESGLYYQDCNVAELHTPETRKAMEDPKLRSKLWKNTQKLIDDALARIK